MSVEYPRTYTSPCAGVLLANINANGLIVPGLEQIIQYPTQWVFVFSVALSPAEVIEFDNTLATFVCPVSTSALSDIDDANVYTFSAPGLQAYSWMRVGQVVSSSVGVPIPFDGTIIGVAYHQDFGAGRDIDLYINSIFNTFIISIVPGNGNNMSLNIPVKQNDKLQLRGGSGGFGYSQGIVVDLYVKWT